MNRGGLSLYGVVILAWALGVPLCSAQSPKLEKEITGLYTGPVFTPDGKAVALLAGDGSVVLWNYESGKKVVLKGSVKHSDYRPLAFCPDGKTLATVGSDNAVRLWDAATGKEVRKLTGHAKAIHWLRFGVDGKELLTASWEEEVLKRWEVETGKEISSYKVGQAWACAVSPDGKMVATGNLDGSVYLWDLGTGRQIRRLDAGRSNVSQVAFCLEGKRLLSLSHNTGTVKHWEVETGEYKFGSSYSGIEPAVGLIAVSPDSKVLAVGVQGHGQVFLQTLDNRKLGTITMMSEPKSRVFLPGVAFSPDSRRMAVVYGYQQGETEGGGVKLFDISTLGKK